MASQFADNVKGVALSKEEMDTIQNFYTIAAKIEKAGFVIKPGTVNFCPLAWLVGEVVVAVAHYCFEESHFAGGDIAVAQKAYDATAVQLQGELRKLEAKSNKKGAQLLTEFKNYMRK
jgi:hypothetical protein